MKLIKSKKYRKCKKGCDIWMGDFYYPQRSNKALCREHGSPDNLLLRWAFSIVGGMNGKR